MNDQELDALIASLAITEERVAQLDLGSADTELREVIMASPILDHVKDVPGDSDPAGGVHARRWRRRPAEAFGAAAVIALAVVLVILQPFGRVGTSAWAKAVVEAAENGPLLLVGEPGWSVVRADIDGEAEGEMTFSDGSNDVDLFWRDPAGGWIEDRADFADHQETLEVLGHKATLFRYAGSGGDYTTLFNYGRHLIEVRGFFSSLDGHKAVLLSLEQVDVDAWLSAMPESVIASADRAAAVREMLKDVPLPDGFDPAALEEGRLRDRYQLGAVLSGSVACAWLDQWVAAAASGDEHAAAEAVAALQTSRDWPILREMESEGDYSEVLWEYADAVAGDGTVAGDPDMTVAGSYVQALGCGQES